METQQQEWIEEFSSPYPMKEGQNGDVPALYIPNFLANSYFGDLDYVFPIIEGNFGKVRLIYHTSCPLNYLGRQYRIHRHKRQGRVCTYLPVPKHYRASLVQGKKNVRYDLKILVNSEGKKAIVIELYGGR